MSQVEVPAEVLAVTRGARRVVVLTGAGMSAESGVPTFRDAHTGLFARYDADELVTDEAWSADPPLVWAWHWWLARLIRRAGPNPGHLALAAWARLTHVDVITQNIDDLHERAGSDVLAHLHGDLFAFCCGDCDLPYALSVPPLGDGEEIPDRMPPPTCPDCGGLVRPRVVLFGERLPLGAFDAAVDAMLRAEVALVVGTSGIVQPAAALPDIARGHRVPVVEINPDETALTWGVDVTWRERSAGALVALVAALGGSS